MPAVAETLDTVQSVTQAGYKWGFSSDIDMDVAPQGLERGYNPPDFIPQTGAGLAA